MARLIVFVGIIGGLAIAAAILGLAPNADELRDFGASLHWAGYVLWVPLTTLLASVFVPGPVLAAAAGLLFGTAVGTPLAIAATVTTAVFEMAIGRFFAGDKVGQVLPERVRRIDGFLERRGFWAVLYVRIVPGVPFNLVNYGAGLTKLRFRDMAGGTLLGASPRTFAYVALGGHLSDLTSPPAIAAVALLVVIGIAGFFLARRQIKAERRRRRSIVEMTRVIPARPATVFGAFTRSDELAQWWGPQGFTVPSLQFDPRPGADYRIEMQPPDGDSFYLSGEFREVDAPERLAFTFAWEDPDPDDVETVAELSFRDLGEATEVKLTQGPFKTEARRELHRDGWSDTLDKLERFLARD
jgi:uncharacterized membrane protein YdjX (TVP38/TMEM64 family)/uncharacterized protein YndB with AHSA1/START domain